MLPIENLPSDPNLKSLDDVDRIKTPSQIQVVVDLSKSDFDDDNHNNSINPTPTFSIRDYVCSTRSKNIATNWPFSEKNLQLCRKHGLIDLLPPFQSLDSVREQCVMGCVINLLDQESLSNPDRKTTRQSQKYKSFLANGASCNQKLNLESLHITSSVSDQGEGEIPSKAEQFHSKKDSEAASLSNFSTKQVEGATLSETHKTDIITQREPSLKKSRVILKLGTSAGTSSKEPSTYNSFMVSEIMASKVCPICKTFSSSSNTTLNAHIDQCLSGESTMKWKEDPKVIKHRIKPRKMRVMVDIYATAEHCTLEDLDRRNGTNWAVNTTPIDQSDELCVKERVERMPSGGIEETGHEEGEVYIDTNGKKVRILSNFSNSATAESITRAQKIDKGGRLRVDKKKKKLYVLKHQTSLKLATHGQACSSKPHPTFETRGGSSRHIAVNQPSGKEVQLGEHSNGQEPITPGILRQWVGCKRTGLTRKTPRQDNHQHSGHNLKDFVGEKEQSDLANSYAGSNCILNRQQSFKDLFSSESSRRMENSSNEPSTDLYREKPPHKRRREEFYLGFKRVGFGKQCMILPKHKKLRSEGNTVRDSYNSSLNRAASGSSSLIKKVVGIDTAPTRTSDSFISASKSSYRHQAFSSKATKFISTRKKHILTNQGTVPKFSSDFKRKTLAPTRSQVNSKSESDSNFARTISLNKDDHPDFTDKQSKASNFDARMSNCQTRVLRTRKNNGAMKVSRMEEAPDCLKNSPSEPPYNDHAVGETKEFSAVDIFRSFVDSEDSVDGDGEESRSEDTPALGKHVDMGKTFKEGTGGSFKSSSNSLDPEFDELPSSSEESKSERCAEVNQRHWCGHPVSLIEPSDNDKEELFSAARVGHLMIREDIHMEAHLDSKNEQVNYFSEVDPIPIPGPPGSLLPSPRHMRSDDLQGNSSLTTCKIQLTEDQHDHVESDRSDSPASAISDISNPTLAISESRSSKSFFVEPLAVPGSGPDLQEINVGAELPNIHTRRVDVNFPENTNVSSKSEQLCCCSRKEGVQGVPLNFQESPLLKLRTISSLPFPEKKHMGYDCYERFGKMNLRSELFSLGNYPNPGSGTLIHPSSKLAPERIDKNFSAEHEVNFPSQRDQDSASPSASTPVLRLMGKNLMVVNNDADVSLQHTQNHLNSINPHQHLQCSAVSGFSHGGVGPIVLCQDQRQDAIGQQYDAKVSYKCGSYVDVKTPTTPVHASGHASGLYPSKNEVDACKTLMEQHEHKLGNCVLSKEQRPKINRLDNLLSYGLENKVASPGDHKCHGVGSISSRDIILIDDATDIKADSAIDMLSNEDMRRTRVSLYRNSVPGTSDLSSRFANTFYSDLVEGACSMYDRRPVLQNTAFQLPISDGTNASLVNWNCNPEGLNLLGQGTLGAPSSYHGHPRPTFYYSQVFYEPQADYYKRKL